jgi:hypothetical protein
MKPVPALCVLLAAAPAARGEPPNSVKVASTVVLHDDGTRTDSVKDLFKHELTETVYDGRKVVIAKKKFLLGENGNPTQGTIYDGADNVVARVQFFFDDLGRVTEERCTNTQNEIFQRVIRQYDVTGKPLKPQVFSYAAKAPNMGASRVDFTQPSSKPGSSPGSAPVRPGQSPQIETASPGSRTVTPSNYPGAGQPPNLAIPQGVAPKEEAKKGSKLNPMNWFKK